MFTRSKLLPGETLRAEPRSDDEGDSDDDGHGNLKGLWFMKILPHDHAKIDKSWNEYKPKTRGQAKLKKVIDKYSR
jgi:hypothetical protein